VGGDAGAEGRRLCGMLEDSGLVGVFMGRGAPERDILLGLRAWAWVGEANMAAREDEAVAEAAMSVSESSMGCTPTRCWSSRDGPK
jgi:hypothetical protein